MISVDMWKSRIINDIYNLNNASNDKNVNNAFYKFLDFLYKEDFSVGESNSSYKYINNNISEKRANIYFGKIGLFKLIIYFDPKGNGSYFKIQAISKCEKNTIRIRRLSDWFYQQWLNVLKDKNTYRINKDEVGDLIEKIINLKKLVYNFVDEPIKVPTISDFNTFFKNIGESVLLERNIIYHDKSLNINSVTQLINLMKEENIYRIENKFGWYLTVKGDYCIPAEKGQFIGNLEDLQRTQLIFENQSTLLNPFYIDEKIYTDKNFRLLSVEVHSDVFNTIKIDFNEGRVWSKADPCISVLIGANGTGKTYILSNIEKIFQDIRQRLFKLSSGSELNSQINSLYIYNSYFNANILNKINYKIKYQIEDTTYYICKNDETIDSFKKGKQCELSEVILPDQLIAYSYMVSDKFTFKSYKEDSGLDEKDNFYEYLGVRSASNATMSSTVDRILLSNLARFMCNMDMVRKLSKIVKFLNLLPTIRFSFKLDKKFSNGTLDNKKLAEEVISTRFKEKELREEKNKYILIYEINLDMDLDMDLDIKLLKEFNVVNKLVENRIIDDINIEMKRTNYYEVGSSSSGEKHYLFFILGILSKIKKNSLILIDEPEISLHPNWQQQFIGMLKDIFSEYNSCHFLIATHSHFMISDLNPSWSSVISLRNNNNQIESKFLHNSTYGWSTEDILYNIFNMTTTRNYFLAAQIDEVLLAISQKKPFTNLKPQIERLKMIEPTLKDVDPLKLIIKKIIEKADKYE
jgi:ABC-type lipoprotein export system ATPase subunit